MNGNYDYSLRNTHPGYYEEIGTGYKHLLREAGKRGQVDKQTVERFINPPPGADTYMPKSGSVKFKLRPLSLEETKEKERIHKLLAEYGL